MTEPTTKAPANVEQQPPVLPAAAAPQVTLSPRAENNIFLLLALIFLGSVYYYRHYAELLHSYALQFVAGGFFTVLLALRSKFFEALKLPLFGRAKKWLAKIVEVKLLTWILAVAILVVGLLFFVTSSIVLTYDANVATPPTPFTIAVSGEGSRPFSTLDLAISGQDRVSGEIFYGWFPRRDLTFDMKTPRHYDTISPKSYAPYSRVRLQAPSSFREPILYLVTIVPGPNLLSSLPFRTTPNPPQRYYLRIRSQRGLQLLTDNYHKELVITGAESRFLPAKIESALLAELPTKFAAAFPKKKLEGNSLEFLTSTIAPLGIARFASDEGITIEAGQLMANGTQGDPLATTQVYAKATNQFAFLELNQ